MDFTVTRVQCSTFLLIGLNSAVSFAWINLPEAIRQAWKNSDQLRGQRLQIAVASYYLVHNLVYI